MTSRLQAGSYLMQMAILTDANYPMGTNFLTPNSPTVNTVYAPLIVPGWVDYQPASASTQIARSFASQRPRGSIILGKNDLGIGTLTLSEYDDTFDALVMGYTVDTTTATAQRRTGSNVARTVSRKFLVSFSVRSADAANTQGWDTIFKNNVFFDRPELGTSQSDGTNSNNRTYQMYINTSTRKSTGQLATASSFIATPDAEEVVPDTAPIMWWTYIHNNSATTHNSPYAPDYTEVAGAHNVFFLNGTENKALFSGISGSAYTYTAAASGAIQVIQSPSTAILSFTG